ALPRGSLPARRRRRAGRLAARAGGLGVAPGVDPRSARGHTAFRAATHLPGGDRRARPLRAGRATRRPVRPVPRLSARLNRTLGRGRGRRFGSGSWAACRPPGGRPAPHRAGARAAAMHALPPDAIPRPPPRRLALFGIPPLPPAYLAAFRRLAEHVDVSLFLLDPCSEYWADLIAERDLPRR